MLTLSPAQVMLGAQPTDKETAIRAVAQLLADTGHIQPAYTESMLKREEVADTYLGHGVAIPHGLPEDRDLILKTGIAVLQVPTGVAWRPDATAHLIIGIAARSDEHLGVLRRLTRLLQDGQQVQRLVVTSDVAEIIQALTGEPPVEAPALPHSAFEGEVAVTLRNKHGLHARPATVFVRLAKQFQATIRVRLGERVADGKSLLSLLQLGADCGTTLYLSAEGADAPVALKTLREAIQAGLEDEVQG
jgi:phosphocarrier protein FPr